ncbi:hypothetical protein D3C86_2052890 [compost metagenome]
MCIGHKQQALFSEDRALDQKTGSQTYALLVRHAPDVRGELDHFANVTDRK